MPPEPKGICPNCEARRGPVGEPCPEGVCGRKGYQFIPLPWFEAAREYSARKQKGMDPLLGRRLDRYLLAGKLGEGGMGAVYLALQQPLQREVALKLISGVEMTQTTRTRFEREARAISVLDHPNIVRLYDYGIGRLDFDVPYMALEYVRHGRTLRHSFADLRKSSGGRIPGDVVLSVFGQVLHALTAAHRVGIVHRDMKPDNVMVAPFPGNPFFVKVLDFGLAKAVAEVSGFDVEVSKSGQFLGTPLYMAPEQAPSKGRGVADARSDLYAVAVMLYEVFTGVRAFDGETGLEVMVKKTDPDHRPLEFPEARGLPRGLKAFLGKGMSARSRDRFQDAAEMLDAFETAIAGRTTTAAGMAPKPSGSSSDRPATPPSPLDGVPPQQTTRPLAEVEGGGEGPDDEASTRGRTLIQRLPRPIWWVAAGVAGVGTALALIVALPRGDAGGGQEQAMGAIDAALVPDPGPDLEPADPGMVATPAPAPALEPARAVERPPAKVEPAPAPKPPKPARATVRRKAGGGAKPARPAAYKGKLL